MTIQQALLSSGAINWLQVDNTNGAATRGITQDPQGNIFYIPTGAFDLKLVKFNSLGVLQWARTIQYISSGQNLVTDSSGNIYLCGGGLGNKIIVAKFDTNGNIVWQFTYTDGALGTQANYIHCDSSDNIYIAGSLMSQAAGYVLKINSSGTLQWSRKLTSSSSNTCFMAAIATDTFGNVYVSGTAYDPSAGSSTNYAGQLIKYNSSGTLQWKKSLYSGVSSQTTLFYTLAIDFNNNIYITGNLSISSTSYTIVVKYDTSGNLQWSYTYTTASTTMVGNALVIGCNSVGNLYIPYAGSSLVCLDSSANIVWQNYFPGLVSSNVTVNNIISNGKLLYGCFANNGVGGLQNFASVLPDNGSKIGTYILNGVSQNYSTGSFFGTLSTSTISVVAANSPVADSSVSLTAATGPLTNTAYAASNSVTYI